MSLGSLVFVVFCLLAVRLARQALKFLCTEHIGTVTEHFYSEPREEEEWLYCFPHPDQITGSWVMEQPVKIRHDVPTLPFIGIRLADGKYLTHVCTSEEFDALVDGATVRFYVYAIGTWRLYTSAPRVVA